jgi:hypothetical protein
VKGGESFSILFMYTSLLDACSYLQGGGRKKLASMPLCHVRLLLIDVLPYPRLFVRICVHKFSLVFSRAFKHSTMNFGDGKYLKAQ